MHVYDTNGRRETVNSLLFGTDSKIWIRDLSNELCRLSQGNKYGVKPIDTIDLITNDEVPITSKVTYENFVRDYRTLKSEPHRIILVAGGES